MEDWEGVANWHQGWIEDRLVSLSLGSPRLAFTEDPRRN